MKINPRYGVCHVTSSNRANIMDNVSNAFNAIEHGQLENAQEYLSSIQEDVEKMGSDMTEFDKVYLKAVPASNILIVKDKALRYKEATDVVSPF